MTDMIAVYLVGYFATAARLAWIDVHSLREAFWLSLLWPLLWFAVVFILISQGVLAPFGWDWDMADSDGTWGKRKAKAGRKGFAYRCPWFEVRVFRKITDEQRRAELVESLKGRNNHDFTKSTELQ
jgi:hypothetical protein